MDDLDQLDVLETELSRAITLLGGAMDQLDYSVGVESSLSLLHQAYAIIEKCYSIVTDSYNPEAYYEDDEDGEE